MDQPLAIQALHRFLADQDLFSESPFIPEVKEQREEKVAIIGAGPAGLSAAYFLAQRGYQVTVFEKLPVAGGMMRVGIPAYRLPRDIISREINIIEKLGVNIKTNVTFGKDINLKEIKEQSFKAIFIATGLHQSRELGIQGEDLKGVLKGVSFLRDIALEKSISVGKEVVVIGGGNVAIDVALSAKRIGAEIVTMVCLETREEMPAWDYEIEEALEEGINILHSFGPECFLSECQKIVGIDLKKCTNIFDSSGAFNPKYDLTERKKLSTDTVIVAIGQEPDLSWAKNQELPINSRSLYTADPDTYQTDIPWIFAGGDAFYGPKSVVDAVSSGKEAAESIHRYLNGLDLTQGREKTWSYEKPDTSKEPKLERQPLPRLPISKRERNFKEVTHGYTEQEALQEASRCLKCGICSECYQCLKACLAEAIDHTQKPKERNIEVGSVILGLGSEIFYPSLQEDLYFYKTNPDVLTSLEFERILSASGPTMGHLQRLSDNKEPQKIAWLQCVGSRDTHRCGNGYCSFVCCMYAVKEAMIAKEHSHGDLDCAIFNMDIRTFGKDYEKYYTRAEQKDKVRFIRSRIHSIEPVPNSNDLLIHYVTESGEAKQELFDMVVLSVGLQPPQSLVDLTERLDIQRNKYNFIHTPSFSPIETTRDGVFVCGTCQSPKDIPSSVTDASAAACEAGKHLAKARHLFTKEVKIPDEIDITQQEPRIGVFICNCGINIGGIVNVDEVEKYCSKLPGVTYTTQNLFTCSEDAQQQMKEAIKENGLNRVVVASCTPKTHENIFMETLEACGLNKYLFEMANIRNQNSWVHSNSPEEATEKAKELTRMAVARAAQLHPLHEKKIPVIPKALVIGGGIAGMNAALALGEQGFETFLLEKEYQLGGIAKRLSATIEGADIPTYLEELITKVNNHPSIQVLTQSLIVSSSGFKGNFTTEILVGPGMYERKLEHGVIILATGANEYKPQEYLYNQDERVMTQLELGEYLDTSKAQDLNKIVMIQCIGSRNENNPNCSRVCCQSAVKNALKIKEINPKAQVVILYRDIIMYGLLEDYYTKAREKGVLFFRYKPENPPTVESTSEGIKVNFSDPIIGKSLETTADILALSAGVIAEDTEELASIIKLARNTEGHFIEAHAKLRPIDMATEGIFVCGTAHSPQLISESISQAKAAVSRATTYLSQSYLTLSAVTAKVDPEKCTACLICVRSCPFEVPKINEEGICEIDEALCHGCGICAAECPAMAIQLNWYEDLQITSKIDALLEEAL